MPYAFTESLELITVKGCTSSWLWHAFLPRLFWERENPAHNMLIRCSRTNQNLKRHFSRAVNHFREQITFTVSKPRNRLPKERIHFAVTVLNGGWRYVLKPRSYTKKNEYSCTSCILFHCYAFFENISVIYLCKYIKSTAYLGERLSWG